MDISSAGLNEENGQVAIRSSLGSIVWVAVHVRDASFR